MANNKHEAPIYCFPNTHTAQIKGHKNFCKCVLAIFFHWLSTSLKKICTSETMRKMQSAVNEYETTENIGITSVDCTRRFQYKYLPRCKSHSDLSCHIPAILLCKRGPQFRRRDSLSLSLSLSLSRTFPSFLTRQTQVRRQASLSLSCVFPSFLTTGAKLDVRLVSLCYIMSLCNHMKGKLGVVGKGRIQGNILL